MKPAKNCAISEQHKLEILLAWLEDNVEMGTTIEFAYGVDSSTMIPAVKAAVGLLNMPKAKRCEPPFGEYYHTEATPDAEMNRSEANIWNAAREYVVKQLQQEIAA